MWWAIIIQMKYEFIYNISWHGRDVAIVVLEGNAVDDWKI